MGIGPVQDKSRLLQNIACDVFRSVLRSVNAERAVMRGISLLDQVESDSLLLGDVVVTIQKGSPIYSVAVGKAAFPIARGLTKVLGSKLKGGVISGPDERSDLPPIWKVFHGGHPVPNNASLEAAKAAFKLLKIANTPGTLVVFLISGGGSAMMELPTNEKMTVADLQAANQTLITCGATISEINSIRCLLSKVKGGGLSRAAHNANLISLIVSDTNSEEIFNVASGPTVSKNDFSEAEIRQIMVRYELSKNLLKTVNENSLYRVLLENQHAVRRAVSLLRRKGFMVETFDDLAEAEIEYGCSELIRRLLDLRQKTPSEKPVAVVSGGEFVCPVRGNGLGGRNSEAALRSAILFNQIKLQREFSQTKFTALFAGTDGIDGNSPAAGAIASEETIEGARKLNLNAMEYLSNSDSYSFFSALGDAVRTGP